MEFTLEYLWLYIILVVFGLAYLVLTRPNSVRRRPPLPPGRLGWPIVGESLELQGLARLGRQGEFIDERRKRYNRDVFKTAILGEKTIAICGAAGNKFIFTSEKSLVLTCYRLLHQEVMDQLVERFDKTCKKCMESDWIRKYEVLAFSLIKKYAFCVACDMFASMDDPKWQAMILKEFNVLLKGVFQLPIYFPGTRHFKAVKAAEVIRKN
ncbi:hypothetical protein Syun_002720 [Stephania yunnanensis]|uniref:Cytochrome P450 n=1 Tax=Stephania yunnanensis TaxID=152371 RepID=A0AAP0LJ65_9MAGN